MIATCAAWPEISPSDERLAAALRGRGWDVTPAPWNGDFTPFARPAAIVVRSTWDFHEASDAYLTWLGRLEPRRTFNAPDLIRWNLAKTHVLALARRGAPVPRSLAADARPAAVAAALDALGLRDGVIKPLIGASGFGVQRVYRGEESSALEYALAHKATDRVLVQEFLPGIVDGELAGVFFDGIFSHGLRRIAAPGEFRVNYQYGGRMEAAALPATVVEQMQRVLALLPEPALYARIDGVMNEGRFVVMEVEVNEPWLGLDVTPGSGERFADALLTRL